MKGTLHPRVRALQFYPDKPTVRDERGAHGDVDDSGIRNPLLVSKERMPETLHLRLHTPCFYPTFARLTVAGRDERPVSRRRGRGFVQLRVADRDGWPPGDDRGAGEASG